MISDFTREHIPAAIRSLRRYQFVWAAIYAVMFAAGFLLSDSLPPEYLATAMLPTAWIVTETIHRSFPMGNMRMVLVLSPDIRSTSEWFLKASILRLLPYIAVFGLMLFVGIALRIGFDHIRPEVPATILYMAAACVLLIMVRWVSAVRFGRAKGMEHALLASVLALCPFALLTFMDWTAGLCSMAAVLAIMAATFEVIRRTGAPSKDRMLGGI